VSRTDSPGVVQIGLEPKAVQELLKSLDIQSSIASLDIGNGGFGVILDENGTVLHDRNTENIGKDSSELPWIQKVLEEKNTLHTVDVGNAPYYAMAETVLERTYLVTYPRAEILAITRNLLINNIVTVIVSIILLMAVISFVI